MKKKTRELILGSLFLALGIIVPYIFHTSGIPGAVFLPMHIPVIIGGFFLSPAYAALVGILSPIVGSLATGMPVFYPIGIIMAFELMVYGVSVSLMKKKLSVYYTLIFGMILGRVAAAFVVFSMQQFFGLKMNYMIYIKGAIITGLPGIVIQLILIPIIVNSLKRIIRR